MASFFVYNVAFMSLLSYLEGSGNPKGRQLFVKLITVFFELFSPTIKSLVRYTVIGVLTVELLDKIDNFQVPSVRR